MCGYRHKAKPTIDYDGKYAASVQTIKDNYAHFEEIYRGTDNNPYTGGRACYCDAVLNPPAMAPANNPLPQYEEFQYFYHPDHLGSTTMTTDAGGHIAQRVEYIPFGEVFVEERNNTWHTPFLFNAKELDEETGLYYYGARYYDPRTSLWLSVDPLAEKYPGVSAYAYCLNNPVKLVDPDGMDPDEFFTWFSNALNQIANWWTGGENYQGSGWGYGARQGIARQLGIDNKASSVAEVGILSQLHFDEVEIVGQALEKIKSDPAMIVRENTLMEQVKSNEKYGKEAFSTTVTANVEFGGKRAPGSMSEQFADPFNPKYADTWKVAGNELTWLIRHANVESIINVDGTGKITMNHTLTDKFDLRPGGGHTKEYNTATSILGFLYHDIVGGNDELKIKATWTTEN